MTVKGIIDKRRERHGTPIRELARRTGIGYSALYSSLKGNRKITAAEFVVLCRELELTLDDFDGVDG